MRFSSICITLLILISFSCSNGKNDDLNDKDLFHLNLVESYENEMTEIGAETLATRLKIVEANQNYDTTRVELEALYAQLNALAQKLGDTVKQYSQEAREHCSEEEWGKIATQRADAINFNY